MNNQCIPLIGVDIVSIERITYNITKGNSNFIERVFTENEINYCKNKNNPYQHFAARYAGKEAICKVLKISRKKGWNRKEIEITNINDIPQVNLYGQMKNAADERKIKNITLSLSHERNYAIAFVVALL